MSRPVYLLLCLLTAGLPFWLFASHGSLWLKPHYFFVRYDAAPGPGFQADEPPPRDEGAEDAAR